MKKRIWILFLCLLSVFVLASNSKGLAPDPAAPSVMTKELQERMTPEEILQTMKDGNQRFIQGKMLHRDYLKEKDLVATAQHPFALVLSCMDSRKPAEIIFDAGIGDFFNVRIAGNFVNTDILGSMEYATAVSGSKLILVMGHTNCGAIKSAIDHVEMGNITSMLQHILPAVNGVSGYDDRTSKNKKFVEAVAKRNVELAEENITKGSSILKGLEDSGKLEIAGCMYDLETGVVSFYE